MVRATGKGVVRDLLNKLAKYLGEGTSRKAAEGNFRRFSFFRCTQRPPSVDLTTPNASAES
jgi:hypothetical protein